MEEKGPWTRHWHWLIPIGLMGYFGLWVANGKGWTIAVPNRVDPRLVGRWSGVWTGPGRPVPRSLTFDADGSWNEGEERRQGSRRSRWGTEDGRLHVKWLATDAWIGKAFSYRLDEDGQTLRLERAARFGYLFPAILRRDDEKAPRP